MSSSFKVVEFDEDHCPGQKIIERYNHTSDYQDFIYVDEHGTSHKLFGGSDAMIDALSSLITNRHDKIRVASNEEKEVAVEALRVS